MVTGLRPVPPEGSSADTYTSPGGALLNLSCRFHHDGRPIRQNFRDALHHFRRVVAGSDDGVASHIRRVLQHQVERFGARPLAEIGQQSNVAADQCLQTSSNVPKIDRDRTVIPRTTPSVRTTRKPSSSNCVVTMLCRTALRSQHNCPSLLRKKTRRYNPAAIITPHSNLVSITTFRPSVPADAQHIRLAVYRQSST